MRTSPDPDATLLTFLQSTYEAAATTGHWDREALEAGSPSEAAPMTEGSRKAILAAFFANLGIAIAKFVGFLITSSAGLLAESFHSLADTGNQGLLMLGGKRAARKPDAEHPFGYGRERYFWAFVVALVLFSLGGLFALYEGISKLRHPHEVDNLMVAIVILVFAICLETFSLRTAYREAKHAQGPGESWWQYIRTREVARAPRRAARGHRRRDRPVLRPRRRAPRPLHRRATLGRARLDRHRRPPRVHRRRPGHRDEGPARRRVGVDRATSTRSPTALTATPNVRSVIHMKTQHIGPDELIVAAKVEFDPDLTMAELATAIDAAERSLRDAVPIAKLVYLEPDVRRASADETLDVTANALTPPLPAACRSGEIRVGPAPNFPRSPVGTMFPRCGRR